MLDTDFLLFPARKGNKHSNEGLFEIYGKKSILARIGNGYLPGLAEAGQRDVEELLTASGAFPDSERKLAESIFRKFRRKPEIPKIMGILNATPDSFFPGSRVDLNNIKFIDDFLDQKPDVIDVGGESTRPGSARINVASEAKRIIPVIRYLRECTNIPVSVDTRNPETLQAVVDLGVSFINDISGFSDERMIELAGRNRLKCIVMHMKGDPSTMQNDPKYTDVVRDVNYFLFHRASRLVRSGINPENIILDPGIGFGKTFDHNLALLRNLDSINLGFETLIGVSRKSFIGELTGRNVDSRLAGTIGSSVYLMEKKVDYLRVHDVRDNRDALLVYRALTG
ncbi:MAG: dihydropteroate synthase [Thermoplasmataceae archaeon]|jgi:dihydropteroate synthase